MNGYVYVNVNGYVYMYVNVCRFAVNVCALPVSPVRAEPVEGSGGAGNQEPETCNL